MSGNNGMFPDWLMGALKGLSGIGKVDNGAGNVQQMEPSGGLGMAGGGVTKSINPGGNGQMPQAAQNFTDPLMSDKSWLNMKPKDIMEDITGFFGLFG